MPSNQNPNEPRVSIQERQQCASEFQSGLITFTQYRQIVWGEDKETAMQTLNQIVEEKRLLRG